MQLHQLRYFVQVAELGSFSRAAQQLRVAQPALSRQVRLLEESLGTRLLVRDGRGAQPTPAGLELMARARDIFRLLSEAEEAVGQRGQAIEGVVRLGCPPSIGLLLVPPLLVACQAEHPKLTVQVMESSNTEALEEWLVSGRVDVAVLGAAGRVGRAVQLRSLATDTLCLVGPPALMPGQARTCRLAQLAQVPLILPGAGHGLRSLLDAACAQQDLRITPRFEVDSVAIIKALAIRGVGCAVLPYATVREELLRRSLKAREIVSPRLTRELLLATALDRAPSAASQFVQRQLQAAARGLETAP
ncbi:LysR family transcriptional regulator [Falsiroseomonas sp.]|uniref:LysR family transcriptional regulator n=1 Tax=Falsiroseomonas sp. TaxID=2870721 RepID=UPI003F725C6A